jgi:hypothetical protein
MSMTKTQKEALLASAAKCVVEALENSSSFTYKVNSIATEAAQDAIDELKESIDLSVEEKINEAVQNIVKRIDWANVGEEIDLSDIELGTESPTLTVNHDKTYMVDNRMFYGEWKLQNLEQLVAFMRFACEDVSFLEHAKRISRMSEILENL